MSTTPQPGPVMQQHAGTPPGNIPKGRQTYIMIGDRRGDCAVHCVLRHSHDRKR